MAKKFGYLITQSSTDEKTFNVAKFDMSKGFDVSEMDQAYKVTEYKNRPRHYNCNCPAAFNGNAVKGEGLPCKHTQWVDLWLQIQPASARPMWFVGPSGQFEQRPKSIGEE